MADSPYRWVIVAAGGAMGCVAMGALFALPVLITPMSDATGWSRAGIGSAMTFGFLAMAVASMIWGALSDRFGARPVVAVGAAMLAASLYASSLATSLLMFQLIFGIFAGISIAAFFAPMMATVMGWFTTQRSLAVSLVSAGMGMAPLTMTPLVAELSQTMDWRGVLRIVAIIVAVTTIPLAMFLKRPPLTEAMPGAPQSDQPSNAMTVRQAVTSAPFLVIVATNFLCCATHSGPIFHTVSYAQTCGIALIAAASIYSIEGFAGMFGRIGFGVLGDRFGAKRVLVLGLLAQAFGVLCYYFAYDLWSFYSVAVIVGFIYAGIMPLYSVLIRENFPMHIMGTIMGGTGLAGSLGMATGPFLGGWIYDTWHGYGGLYLASFGLGIGAFLMAMTFRPFARPQGMA